MNEPTQPPAKTFWVGVTAPGLTGRFTLPDEHLAELIRWLAERAGKGEAQRLLRAEDASA